MQAVVLRASTAARKTTACVSRRGCRLSSRLASSSLVCVYSGTQDYYLCRVSRVRVLARGTCVCAGATCGVRRPGCAARPLEPGARATVARLAVHSERTWPPGRGSACRPERRQATRAAQCVCQGGPVLRGRRRAGRADTDPHARACVRAHPPSPRADQVCTVLRVCCLFLRVCMDACRCPL